MKPLLLALLLSGLASAQPRIFYSDLESGPKTGGEGGNGAYVTIYGKGFGATRGSSTITVGGGAVASYATWSDTKVAFQLGSSAATGNIVATVASVASNGIAFTVRSGSIYFVATGGSDGAAGSFAAPWATITKARDTIAAGDIAYVRNSVAQTADDGSGWNTCLRINSSGTSGNPKALVVYPGEAATIGNVLDGGSGGCNSAIRTSGGQAYWVLAGFQINGAGEGFALYGASNFRLVGLNVTCPNGNGASACLESSLSDNFYIYGNTVHHVATNLSPGAVSALYHGVYFSTDTNHIWFGWNTISDVQGCRGLQIHSTPLGGGTGNDQYDIHIHDNVIHDTQCDGMILATIDPSQSGGVEIYNNVIYNAGKGPANLEGSGSWSCIHIQSATNNGTPGSGTTEVFNNTMYNCGSYSSPPYPNANAGLMLTSYGSTTKFVRLRNNIFSLSGSTAYLINDVNGHICTVGEGCAYITGTNNITYGSSAVVTNTSVTGSSTSNPLFVTAGSDFHLQSGSPAKVAGTTTSQATDFDGLTLPQGAAYPIGAYAYATGSSSQAAVVTGGATFSGKTTIQ